MFSEQFFVRSDNISEHVVILRPVDQSYISPVGSRDEIILIDNASVVPEVQQW